MFLPTYTESSMTLPKYQANEDYGYVIDILDQEETDVCHIDNTLCDKPRMPLSPYSVYAYADHNLVLLEEGRAEESYMTKAKKKCTKLICNYWKNNCRKIYQK